MSNLYTIKDLAQKSGLSFPEVESKLRENGMEPVEKKGLLRFYDDDALDLLGEGDYQE